MPSFAENVFDIFQELEVQHGFVPVRAEPSKLFASMVHQEVEDVYFYLFVSDGRPKGGEMNVSLWIAPPDEAGDGLDALRVGFKVHICSQYEVDDEYFLGCQKRVIQFLPCARAMVPIVREELKNPAFRTRRWTVYRLERQATSALLHAAEEGIPEAIAAVEAANALARGGRTMKKLDDACRPVAAALLEGNRLESEVLEFYRGDVELQTSALATKLYVRALGSLSVSRSSGPACGHLAARN